jgi:hypothetical protein
MMPELFGNYCDNRLIMPVDVRALDAARPPHRLGGWQGR